MHAVYQCGLTLQLNHLTAGFGHVFLTGVMGQAVKWIIGAVRGHSVGSSPLYLLCASGNDHILCVCAYMFPAPYGISLIQTCMHLFFPIKVVQPFVAWSNWRSCECWLFESEKKIHRKETFPFFCQLICCTPVSNEQLSLQYQLLGCVLNLISSSNGTCQMRCEQLAYQTITVMVCCLLWFQHMQVKILFLGVGICQFVV